MKTETENEVAALVPQDWDLRVCTVEGVLFLGKATIREMIRDWRQRASSIAADVKNTDGMCKFMHDKCASDIRKIAQQYEDPAFPHIGVREDNPLREPEPLDADSINRKCGATTFNCCGWCKHAGGGSHRYGYMIFTSCGIKCFAGLGDQKRRFDTPCFLKEAPCAEFDQIRVALASKLDRLIMEKRQADRRIKRLLTLEKRAEKKPVLSAYRPYDWFDLGDRVVCYVGASEGRLIAVNFAGASVVDGFHHREGGVSVRYDERLHTGSDLEGYGGWSGIHRPEVMHEWELNYLIGHPDFAAFWSTQGVRESIAKDFDADRFCNMLANEPFRHN